MQHYIQRYSTMALSADAPHLSTSGTLNCSVPHSLPYRINIEAAASFDLTIYDRRYLSHLGTNTTGEPP